MPDARPGRSAIRAAAHRREGAAGERLDRADGLALYATATCSASGTLADFANRRRNGDRVFFSANQHINPTNVCILRNTCVFCSFARMPKEEGAYTRSLEEVFARGGAGARACRRASSTSSAGSTRKLRLSYYTDMIRGLKERHPQVHIKALTAVEIAHLARIEKMSRARGAARAARRRASPACPAAAPRCSAPRCAPRSPSGS